jgi:hypothetical protein
MGQRNQMSMLGLRIVTSVTIGLLTAPALYLVSLDDNDKCWGNETGLLTECHRRRVEAPNLPQLPALSLSDRPPF